MIIIDKDIPFLQGVFEPYSEVRYLAGQEITSDKLGDASVLIIRTRTRCDANLLANSNIKLIATATIGTDHIDLEYCKNNNIVVVNAKGCNAGGVMQYVITSIYAISNIKSIALKEKTIGIIGVGNTGGAVYDATKTLGINTLLNDPPRAKKECNNAFVDLNYLCEHSDIISCHLPLDSTTYKLLGDDFFKRIKPGCILINASRGEIMDDLSLKRHRNKLGGLIIDTWNNEPKIDLEILEFADIATPHIAGYSYQGKQNGTSMVVKSVAKFLGISALSSFYPKNEDASKEIKLVNVEGMTQNEICNSLLGCYDIWKDDKNLRLYPNLFEKFRADYNFRQEIKFFKNI